MTTLIDVRTVQGGVRVKTADGQRVFLEPGDNEITIDGFTANWHYDAEKQDVRISGAKPVGGTIELVKTTKVKRDNVFSLPPTIRARKR